MPVSQLGDFPSAWGAHQVSFLDQERLVDLFDGPGFFSDGRSDRIDADRAALEFIDDGGQDPVVHLIQAVQVDIQGFQCKLGNLNGDRSIPFDLCEIP